MKNNKKTLTMILNAVENIEKVISGDFTTLNHWDTIKAVKNELAAIKEVCEKQQRNMYKEATVYDR